MFDFNRELIKYINSARTQPKNTGKTIFNNFKNNFNGSQLHAFGKNIDTFQGIEALQNLTQYLNQQDPTHACAHSKTLDQAAQLIAEEKGRQGKTQNQKPKVIYEKIKQFGKTSGKVGQLISLSASTPNQISSYFLIDDGLASRKRRRMLLDPVYRYIGVGQSAHSQYQTITVILLTENLQENDNYFLENSRLSEQIKKTSQPVLGYKQSGVRQSGFRQSGFRQNGFRQSGFRQSGLRQNLNQRARQSAGRESEYY